VTVTADAELGAQADPGLELLAQVHLSLGRLADALDAQQRQQDALNHLIYPLDIPPVPWPSVGGTVQTVLDQPELFGPKLGTTWDIRRLVVTAAAAGTVNVARNSPFGDILLPFTFAGAGTQTQFIPTKALLLRGGERLVFVASGTNIASNVAVGGMSIDTSILGLHLL
jgi:hypothetical protein